MINSTRLPISVALSANGQVEFGALYKKFSNYQPNVASDKDFEQVGVTVVGLAPARASLDGALAMPAEVAVIDADLLPEDHDLIDVLNSQLIDKVALILLPVHRQYLAPQIKQLARVRQIALKGELTEVGLIHAVVKLGLSERAASEVNTPVSALLRHASDFSHPVERVNALAGTRIYAVAGSKGGPGKTTIAVNFAARLNQRGIKTLLMGFDTPDGVWSQLGLPAGPNALNWFRRPGREGFEASLQTTKFGLDVLLSPNDTAESSAIATGDLIERIVRIASDLARARSDWPVSQIVAQAAADAQREAAPGKIAALIDAARDHQPPYAAIVCDLPPTLGTEWSIQPLLRASIVLCVVEPSRSDAMNLLNTVKVLTGALDPRYRVPRDSILAVLNRVTPEDELNPKRMMDMIRGELGGWAPPFIATLPHDPLVRAQQVNFMLPIDKRDAFRQGIDTLVDYFYSDALSGNGHRSDPAGSRFGIRIKIGGR
jgi:MinD-like ATPase involved in chromosome partitioning or flagellar assembly